MLEDSLDTSSQEVKEKSEAEERKEKNRSWREARRGGVDQGEEAESLSGRLKAELSCSCCGSSLVHMASVHQCQDLAHSVCASCRASPHCALCGGPWGGRNMAVEALIQILRGKADGLDEREEEDLSQGTTDGNVE